NAVRSPTNCAVSSSSSTIFPAIPGRSGARQNRLQDRRRALSRLMAAMSPAVTGAKSISRSRDSITRSTKALLQSFEAGFHESGHNGPHDNGGLAIRPKLHAPLDRAAAPVRLDVECPDVIQGGDAADHRVAG